MTDYTLSITTERPYEETVAAVREQLAEAGFGVLTEIDLKATLKTKLDVDVAPQIILGACRPELAHQALQAEPSIAALLPCNVVVRSVGETTTVVEAFDPAIMTTFVDEPSETLARRLRGRPGPAHLGTEGPVGARHRRREQVMDLEPTEIKAIITRMKRANGHLASVIRMMEEGSSCEDVLTQLAAVNKALSRAGYAIVATGLQHCLEDGDGLEGVDVKKMEKLFLALA